MQLSDSAANECPNGVSYAQSGMNTIDVLISIGLGIAGNLVATAVCSLPSSPSDQELATYSLCVTGTSSVVPFLLASRTVEYQCTGGSNAPGIQVPALSPVPGQKTKHADSNTGKSTSEDS